MVSGRRDTGRLGSNPILAVIVSAIISAAVLPTSSQNHHYVPGSMPPLAVGGPLDVDGGRGVVSSSSGRPNGGGFFTVEDERLSLSAASARASKFGSRPVFAAGIVNPPPEVAVPKPWV